MSNFKNKIKNLFATTEVDSVEFYDRVLGIKRLIKKEGKRIDWYDVAFLLPLIFGLSFFYFQEIGIVYLNYAFLMVTVAGVVTVVLLSSIIFLYKRLLWRLISDQITIEELKKLGEVKADE